MIHVVPAVGEFRLNGFPGMRRPDGLTENTTTHDSLTPWDTETAGTGKTPEAFPELCSGGLFRSPEKAIEENDGLLDLDGREPPRT